MATFDITVSVEDLLAKAQELDDEGISFVRLTISGGCFDSELILDAYIDDGDIAKFGSIPSSECPDC